MIRLYRCYYNLQVEKYVDEDHLRLGHANEALQRNPFDFIFWTPVAECRKPSQI